MYRMAINFFFTHNMLARLLLQFSKPAIYINDYRYLQLALKVNRGCLRLCVIAHIHYKYVCPHNINIHRVIDKRSTFSRLMFVHFTPRGGTERGKEAGRVKDEMRPDRKPDARLPA